MDSLMNYHWARGKVDEAFSPPSKETKDSQACQRRLTQMAKKREKLAARKAKEAA
jgi:hypothetical protein